MSEVFMYFEARISKMGALPMAIQVCQARQARRRKIQARHGGPGAPLVAPLQRILLRINRVFQCTGSLPSLVDIFSFAINLRHPERERLVS